MEVYINSEPIEVAIDPEDSLADVLSMVQSNLIDQGDIVTGILIDGEVVDPDILAELKSQPSGEFGEVILSVRPANKFAAEGLMTISMHLENSIGLRKEVVDFLQQGNSQDAMVKLNEYVTFWAGLQSTLGSACRLLGVDVAELEVFDTDGNDGQMVMTFVNTLSEQLNEIKSALESGDFVLLGDILEYEFGDLTDDWLGILQKLALQFDPEVEA